MTGLGRALDAALEACVVPGFSRIGLAVRVRLLPEFTAGDPPAIDGKTVLITGATSGIVYAAAIALARLGAAVHFLARDRGRAERAWRGISAESGSTRISYGLADLEDLAAVSAFASDFRATHDRLDVLIHNAGTINPQFRTDAAGTELTVLGQVLAPFLLTRLLTPALLAAAPSRVITVSSGGMYAQRLDLATLQMPRSRYRGVTAYAKAKRAQVALSSEWARRLAGTGIAFHAMHPGWVNTPGVVGALPRFHRITRPILLSSEQGAGTIVWLATMPPERLGSGRFWHDRRPRPEYPLPWTRGQDPGAARELWDDLAAATATGAPKLPAAVGGSGALSCRRLPGVLRGWPILLVRPPGAPNGRIACWTGARAKRQPGGPGGGHSFRATRLLDQVTGCTGSAPGGRWPEIWELAGGRPGSGRADLPGVLAGDLDLAWLGSLADRDGQG